jgi:hypothetical protein
MLRDEPDGSTAAVSCGRLELQDCESRENMRAFGGGGLHFGGTESTPPLHTERHQRLELRRVAEQDREETKVRAAAESSFLPPSLPFKATKWLQHTYHPTFLNSALDPYSLLHNKKNQAKMSTAHADMGGGDNRGREDVELSQQDLANQDDMNNKHSPVPLHNLLAAASASASATSSSDEEEDGGQAQDQEANDRDNAEDDQEGASSFMNADLQACREGAMAGMVQRVKPYHERYVGQIRRGRWEGRGRLVYSADDPRGRIDYDGEFRAGRRHGKGKLRWRNGCAYKGSWKDDMMQGSGTMKWPTGNPPFSLPFLRPPILIRPCWCSRPSLQGRLGEQPNARRGVDDVAEPAGAVRRVVVEWQAIRPGQDHLRRRRRSRAGVL